VSTAAAAEEEQAWIRSAMATLSACTARKLHAWMHCSNEQRRGQECMSGMSTAAQQQSNMARVVLSHLLIMVQLT
jgi:hypothetical protein